MTLSYRCSNCGVELMTTNSDPLDAEIEQLRARIDRLETAINRYLADDFGCNGGAQIMFEEALGHDGRFRPLNNSK